MRVRNLMRSLTFRLALIYLLMFVLSVGLLLGGAFWAGVARPLGDVRVGVQREAEALALVYPREPRAAFVRRLESRAAVSDRRAAYHALIAPDGRVLTGNLRNWPAPRTQRDWLRFEFESYETGDEVEHEALARDVTFADGMRLIIGRDTEDLDEREDFLRETVLWGAGLTLAIGVAGGLLMSLAVGRRLEAVARTARAVIAGDLSGRIAVQGSGDDFDNLAETLNAMLARIEHLFQSVSRVSDSIAHELRTPLMRLQADLEELAQATQSTPDSHRLVLQAAGEATRLQTIFNALLRIARIEAGRHQARREPVKLSALLRDVVEFYLPEAEAKGQALTSFVPDELTLTGDGDLIFQAVSNMIDNAVKYAPPGGAVSLRAGVDRSGVVITVTDTGPGVTDEHLVHLTERFFRAPGAQTERGTGLGLALVAAIAHLHHGNIGFQRVAAGFEARLWLPRDTP